MMQKYLNTIGLSSLAKRASQCELNDFVAASFARKMPSLGSKECVHLFSYHVPKLSADGSCSIAGEMDPVPYNLRTLLGDSAEMTQELWHLTALIEALYVKIKPDWLGIYKKVVKSNGEAVLLKLAYCGAPSRAEFPLTEVFARTSNNSTVGLSGKAVIVQDVASYTGPYYQCDAKVQSEFCCPIVGEDGTIYGIIDAESFKQKFFTDDKIFHLAKVCMDMGAYWASV